ncbi:MAG: flagellar biosynthetic protein FliQ [Calditrichaeota bacterium]|nr:MAG: flagellar biosynthetic protein FliQ [Calditrichota bacterium]
MTTEFVIFWGQQTVKTAIIITAPILLGGMLVGLIVGILQSVTQIQELTLTFIPKMAAVILVILLLMPWMLEVLTDFAAQVFSQMSVVAH